MPKKIEVGDKVKIVGSRRVTRVGYPKSIADFKTLLREDEAFCADVGAALKSLAQRHETSTWGKRILRGLVLDTIFSESWRRHGLDESALDGFARQLLFWDHFGGNRRDIHFVEAPEAVGAVGFVTNSRRVCTGVREPGYGSGEDAVPPRLIVDHTYQIVTVSLDDGFALQERAERLRYVASDVEALRRCRS